MAKKSSNLIQNCLHLLCTNALKKGMSPSLLSAAMGKIVEQTVFSIGDQFY